LVIQFQPYDLLGNYIVSLYKIGSQYYMYSSGSSYSGHEKILGNLAGHIPDMKEF
jgi:hypothetical protein